MSWSSAAIGRRVESAPPPTPHGQTRSILRSNLNSAVLRAYRQETGDGTVSVIVSTASPYKFGASVLEAVAGRPACEGRDDFACCDALRDISGLPIPDSIARLPQLPVRHTAVCEKQAMAQAVLDAVGKR